MEYYDNDNREIICVMGPKGPQGPIGQSGTKSEYRHIDGTYKNVSGSRQLLIIMLTNTRGSGYYDIVDVANDNILGVYGINGINTNISYVIENMAEIKVIYNISGIQQFQMSFELVIFQL